MNECPPGIDPNDVTEVYFIGKVPVKVLTFRSMKHNFTKGWETEFLSELYKYLKPGAIVFDIGAEEGEFSAFVGMIVGGENVHLFEPSIVYWPNIKRLWEANGLKQPYSYDGFITNKTNSRMAITGGWPRYMPKEIFTGNHQLRTHQEEYAHIDRMTLDYYCQQVRKTPDVIMMDVEGAEVDVIDGAKDVLRNHSPVVFISVHEEIAKYGRTREELFLKMESFGYFAKHIHTDHEEHWVFVKNGSSEKHKP